MLASTYRTASTLCHIDKLRIAPGTFGALVGLGIRTTLGILVAPGISIPRDGSLRERGGLCGDFLAHALLEHLAQHRHVLVGKQLRLFFLQLQDCLLYTSMSAETGDTLSVTGKVEAAAFKFPNSQYRIAIEAENRSDEDKLFTFIAVSYTHLRRVFRRDLPLRPAVRPAWAV